MYQPNTANANSVFQADDNSRLAECSHGDCDMERYNTDLSCIVSHISRLKCNKSPGHDGIVSEHVVFGGHYLPIHICLLFNAMLKHSSVPIDFSREIIIPLLKCKNGDASQLDMYRGITLSPTLSKLFESVLLETFEGVLNSDDLPVSYTHLTLPTIYSV